MQPAFVICATLLLLACVSKKAVLEFTGTFLTKIPIDLRKSFDDIDESKLTPYKVTNKRKIENKEILGSLGTEDYIEWTLVDPDAPNGSPVKFCDLMITYYGKPDRVPHVPEECYLAAGKKQEVRKIVSLNIGGQADPLEARLLVFSSKNAEFGTGSDFSLMYFFNANESYACSRGAVRKTLGSNFRGKYSFFSKVEWKFYGMGFGGRTCPGEEQNIAASEKMISKLLPVLKNEHWPILNDIDGDENNETEVDDNQKNE
jgi:hypothetical protein